MRENVCERITISFSLSFDWMKIGTSFLNKSRSVVSANLLTFHRSSNNRSKLLKYDFSQELSKEPDFDSDT